MASPETFEEAFSLLYEEFKIDWAATGTKIKVWLQAAYGGEGVKLAARLTGKSPRAIYRYLDGTRRISVEDMFHFAQILRMPMEELVVYENGLTNADLSARVKKLKEEWRGKSANSEKGEE